MILTALITLNIEWCPDSLEGFTWDTTSLWPR